MFSIVILIFQATKIQAFLWGKKKSWLFCSAHCLFLGVEEIGGEVGGVVEKREVYQAGYCSTCTCMRETTQMRLWRIIACVAPNPSPARPTIHTWFNAVSCTKPWTIIRVSTRKVHQILFVQTQNAFWVANHPKCNQQRLIWDWSGFDRNGLQIIFVQTLVEAVCAIPTTGEEEKA